MTTPKFPVFFISHGGGPWPWMDGMKQAYEKTATEFAHLPELLPAKPKAILVVTAHWESEGFTVSTGEAPSMLYDYSGFPAHTYQVQYKAPGSPAVAARVRELLKGAGIPSAEDATRGFDHGTFVPLALIYPDADIPVVMLSIKSSYDAAEHIRLGQALAPLREEGVLIIGSGLTYHNMRGFGRDESTRVAQAFEGYLNEAVAAPDAAKRNDMLTHWEQAPAARQAHPQEDHLIPLMVVAGAAGSDVGRKLFTDDVMKVAMTSYEFGAAQTVAA